MEPKKETRFGIIDAAVLLLLLAATVYFACTLRPKPEPLPPTYDGMAYFTVQVDGLRQELYDAVAAELPCAMVADGVLVAEAQILSASWEACEAVSVQAAGSANGISTTCVKPDAAVRYGTAFFLCEAPVASDSAGNRSLSQELRIGRTYYLKGKMIELVGIVTRLRIEKP